MTTEDKAKYEQALDWLKRSEPAFNLYPEQHVFWTAACDGLRAQIARLDREASGGVDEIYASTFAACGDIGGGELVAVQTALDHLQSIGALAQAGGVPKPPLAIFEELLILTMLAAQLPEDDDEAAEGIKVACHRWVVNFGEEVAAYFDCIPAAPNAGEVTNG